MQPPQPDRPKCIGGTLTVGEESFDVLDFEKLVTSQPDGSNRNRGRGGTTVNALANLPRILLIDSNVYFSKRLGDALKQQGFEVVPSAQAAYALTMLEWNAPTAILCATNLREMGALEMAPILRADPKTANIPLDRRGRRRRSSAARSLSRGLR